MGKALDNRLGVATLIELVKNPPANVELLAAFTVQEEIGLRGARVAAYRFNPMWPSQSTRPPPIDLPVWDDSENTQYNTRLGAGPAIYIADAGTLSDPRLIRHLAQTGDDLGIPYQFRQPGGGGTDAGAMHKVRAGVPSVSVSVPGRYAHTAACWPAWPTGKTPWPWSTTPLRASSAPCLESRTLTVFEILCSH